MATKYLKLAEQIREDIDDLQGDKVSDYSLVSKVNKTLSLIGSRLIELKAPLVTKRMKLGSFAGSSDLPSDFQNLVMVTDETADNEGTPAKISGLRYTLNDSNQLSLSWDSDITAQEYRIYDDTLTLLAKTTTNLFNLNVKTGNIYKFFVSGTNENGEGVISDLVTVDLTLKYFKYIEKFDGTFNNCVVENNILKPAYTTFERFEKTSETLLSTSNTIQKSTSSEKFQFLYKDNGKLYYANFGDLHEIDPITKQIKRSVAVYPGINSYYYNINRIISLGNSLFCFSHRSNQVVKINKTAFAKEGAFVYGDYVFTIETDGTNLLVGSGRNNQYEILKVNPVDGSIIETIYTFPYCYQYQTSSIYDNGKLYTTYILGSGATQNIAKIDLATKTIEKTIQIDANMIGNNCIAQIGDYIYLTFESSTSWKPTLYKIKKSDLTIEIAAQPVNSNIYFPFYITTDGTYIYKLIDDGRILLKIYGTSLNEAGSITNYLTGTTLDKTNPVFLNDKVYVISSAATGDTLYEFTTVGYNYSLSGTYESNLIDLSIAGTAIRSLMSFTKIENGTATAKVYIQFTFDSGKTFTPYYECSNADSLPYITGQKLAGVYARIKVEFSSNSIEYAQVENVFFEINQQVVG